MRTILALPFRLAAAIVVIPTKLSARLLRFSTVATVRTTRFALRSSLISFAVGVGAGWFLSTPTGRDLVAQVRGRVQGAPEQPDASFAPAAAPRPEPTPDLDPSEVDLPADTPADEVEGVSPAV